MLYDKSSAFPTNHKLSTISCVAFPKFERKYVSILPFLPSNTTLTHFYSSSKNGKFPQKKLVSHLILSTLDSKSVQLKQNLKKWVQNSTNFGISTLRISLINQLCLVRLYRVRMPIIRCCHLGSISPCTFSFFFFASLGSWCSMCVGSSILSIRLVVARCVYHHSRKGYVNSELWA